MQSLEQPLAGRTLLSLVKGIVVDGCACVDGCVGWQSRMLPVVWCQRIRHDRGTDRRGHRAWRDRRDRFGSCYRRYQCVRSTAVAAVAVDIVAAEAVNRLPDTNFRLLPMILNYSQLF